MKKYLALILSFIILMQSISLHAEDILNIGELIEHAQFHNEKYGDDFFTFLSKHYGDEKSEHEKSHPEEKNNHNKLPFQHAEHMANVLVVHMPMDFIVNFNLVLNSEESLKSFKEGMYSNVFVHDIFQPPKQA